MLEKTLLDKLSTINVLTMFGFQKVLPVNTQQKATIYLTEYLKTFIKNKINEINDNTNLKSVEISRDDLIKKLDNVNFIVKYGYDVKLDDSKKIGTRADLDGFTSSILYNEYSSCIDYIVKNSGQFYEDLDTSINYSSSVLNLSDNQFSDIMADLLSTVSRVDFMSGVFGRDSKTFNTFIENLTKSYNKFITITEPKKFKLSKFKERARDIDISFEITTESLVDDSNVINELISLNKTPYIPINELNYYKIT
jgi:hypothetical protein